MPEVSIVLPTYNGERFIRKSIESVLTQTLTDWELIIVNDCSTDHTPLIVKEYAQKDSRIRIINNPVNKKLPMSLNIGFREAKGRYYTWTSDDNYYRPNALMEMYQFLEKNKSEVMVRAACLWTYESGRENHIQKFDPLAFFVNNNIGACFLYRRKVVDEVGEYDENRFGVEDYDYWLRIMMRYGHIGSIDEVLYVYRYQKDSLSVQRKNLVDRQRFELRKKYFPIIESKIHGREDLMDALIGSMIMDPFFEANRAWVLSLSPDAALINDSSNSQDIVLYGAGKVGQEKLKDYGTRVKFFADYNMERYGHEINGVKLIPLNELAREQDSFRIILSLGDEKVPSALRTLKSYGIRRVSRY